MNRINQLFRTKSDDILSIYFTAGYPALNDTMPILKALQKSGVDLVEIGIPFSDPVADGETIQRSSQQALDNGMSLKLLFEQLEAMRETVTIPVLLMGYLNPVLQFGVKAFCEKCQTIGIDGLILPDMPLDVFEEEYKPIFERYGLINVFLITPQTTDARIRQIDQQSEGFIYMVSSASVTGVKAGISDEQEDYFQRIAGMELRNHRLIGFGISTHDTFQKANRHASGAIIGSAFVKAVSDTGDIAYAVSDFVRGIRKE